MLLARTQFAFTVSFHFLFPAITIGLASYLVVLKGLWLRTGREDYMTLFRYWIASDSEPMCGIEQTQPTAAHGARRRRTDAGFRARRTTL